MHLTHAGLGQGEGTSAFGLHFLLHHQGSGVMEVVNPVVVFFLRFLRPPTIYCSRQRAMYVDAWICEFHFLTIILWCLFSISQTWYCLYSVWKSGCYQPNLTEEFILHNLSVQCTHLHYHTVKCVYTQLCTALWLDKWRCTSTRNIWTARCTNDWEGGVIWELGSYWRAEAVKYSFVWELQVLLLS